MMVHKLNDADATFDGGVQEDSSTFVRSTAAFALGFIGRRAAARGQQEVLEGAVEMLGFALMAPEAEDAVRDFTLPRRSSAAPCSCSCSYSCSSA